MLFTNLKRFFLNKSASYKILPALTIFVSLCANINCGKRKVPLPPVERVFQKVEIAGFQRGSIVQLSWAMPARNAADSSVLNINRIDVYRLAEPLNSTLTLTEEEFSTRSTLIATLPVTSSDFGLKKFTYRDLLEFAGQTARLRYAIRFVNQAGQKAAFSNFLFIEPTAKVAGAPKSLTAEITEDALILHWLAPESNIDGSQPVNLLGYNIYRSASETETAKLINEMPVNKTEFSDKNFDFDTGYFFFIRSVSLGGDGNPLESLESNIINVSPKDTFAPAAPTAITIAAAPNKLSIFFAVNAEKDVVGYRIYRSIDKNKPLTEWENLTPDLLTTNTFQDARVDSGKTYYYYLLAVDKSGNESLASEIASETAP